MQADLEAEPLDLAIGCCELPAGFNGHRQHSSGWAPRDTSDAVVLDPGVFIDSDPVAPDGVRLVPVGGRCAKKLEPRVGTEAIALAETALGPEGLGVVEGVTGQIN